MKYIFLIILSLFFVESYAQTQPPVIQRGTQAQVNLDQRLMTGMNLYPPRLSLFPSGTPLSINGGADTLGDLLYNYLDSNFYYWEGGNNWNRFLTIKDTIHVIPTYFYVNSHFAEFNNTILGANSIIGGGPLSQNNILQLVNDELTPPNNSVYGYQSGGKGWFNDTTFTIGITQIIGALGFSPIGNITGFITSGTNITIAGNGTLLNPYVITSSGGGGGGGTIIMGTINGQPKSQNGAVITDSTLYMQDADTVYRGLVDTTIQAFRGQKLWTEMQTFRVAPTITAFGVGVVQSNSAGLLSVFTPDSNIVNGWLGYTAYDSRNYAGYITGNQTIVFTVSGDISGSSSGTTSLTPTLTIGANAVTYAKFQELSAKSLFGNFNSSTANGTSITPDSQFVWPGGAILSIDTSWDKYGQQTKEDNTRRLDSLAAAIGGGGGTPGGSNTDIQYNNSSVFGGNGNFIYNNSTVTVGLGMATTSTAGIFDIGGSGTGTGTINGGGDGLMLNGSPLKLEEGGTVGVTLNSGLFFEYNSNWHLFAVRDSNTIMPKGYIDSLVNSSDTTYVINQGTSGLWTGYTSSDNPKYLYLKNITNTWALTWTTSATDSSLSVSADTAKNFLVSYARLENFGDSILTLGPFANAPAYSIWGNNTNTSATPNYYSAVLFDTTGQSNSANIGEPIVLQTSGEIKIGTWPAGFGSADTTITTTASTFTVPTTYKIVNIIVNATTCAVTLPDPTASSNKNMDIYIRVQTSGQTATVESAAGQVETSLGVLASSTTVTGIPYTSWITNGTNWLLK